MQPMKSNRRVLTWLCLLPASGATNTTKLFYATYFFVAVSSTFAVFISSLMFFLEFLSIDLEMALFAIWQINGFMTVLYMFAVMFHSRQKLKLAFDKLSAIYKRNKNEDSFRFLIQANNACEWAEQMYFRCTVVCVTSIATTSGFSVLFCWMMNDAFDVARVFQPMRLVLPWNQTSSSGYLVQMSFVLLVTYEYFVANGSHLLMFFSVCLHHQAFSKMFRHSVKKFNHFDSKRNDEESLCNLIRFHVSVKDWFFETADLFSINIAIQLICNMLCLSCVVFQFDLQSKHIDFSAWILLMALQMGCLNLFTYCYYGRLATESYLKMADDLYEVDWQKLPVRLQKYFIIMIGNMQKPLYYRGFGVAVLNLETFGKLIKTVFTYYMLFKTITST